MIDPRKSIQAEKQEKRSAANGNLTKTAYTVFGNKLYLGDGRDYPLRRSDVLVNLDLYRQHKILGASGKIDEANKINPYYDNYMTMYETYQNLLKIAEKTHEPMHQIVGAAGDEAFTHYDAIKKTGELLSNVTGEQRIMEDLLAINIAKREDSTRLKHEFLSKTSALQTVDKELPDNQIPGDARQKFTVDDHDVFADGVAWSTSTRDKELKIDVRAKFLEELPGMFAQSKQDKVIALVNAVSGTNQGDWDAFTSGIPDVRASEQVQTAEDSVKKFGGPLIALMHSDTWRLYNINDQGANFTRAEDNIANRSTNIPSVKSGRLRGNPSVTYFVDDDIDSETYVLAAQNAYMAYIQGMKINTNFQDKRTPGQTETSYWFDFNAFFERETSAVFRGLSVGA